VRLSWAPVAGCTGYLVWQAASSAGPYTVAAYVEGAGYAEGGLGEGVTRHYRVASVNGSAVSAEAASAEARTRGPFFLMLVD
jgi:hypothetical protein